MSLATQFPTWLNLEIIAKTFRAFVSFPLFIHACPTNSCDLISLNIVCSINVIWRATSAKTGERKTVRGGGEMGEGEGDEKRGGER
jgi:hypothetical protein